MRKKLLLVLLFLKGNSKMSTCFFFENFPELVDRLNEYCKKYSKIFFLTDENTSACCLLKLNVSFPFYEIKVNSGEENKNIQTLQFIWNELSCLIKMKRAAHYFWPLV